MIQRVTSIVISIHLLFIILLVWTPTRPLVQRTHHVKVRTVRPAVIAKNPSRPSSQVSQTHRRPSSAPKPPTAKPNTSPKQTVQTSKPKTSQSSRDQTPKQTHTSKKPTVNEKGKPIKKTEAPKKSPPPADVWNEIDQALAKIETKSYPKEKPSLDLPQPLTFLDESTPALASVEGSLDDRVESLLVGFLHDTLHLPEVGEVKIELTIKKDGTVSRVVVVSAESRKNKLYLEQHLPLLQFPMQLDQEKTWTLTFYNEI